MATDPNAEKKQEHERRLEAALTAIFNRFLREYSSSIAGGSQIPGADFSKEDIRFTLEKRYRLVQDDFKGDVFEGGVDPVSESETASSIFEKSLASWRLATSESRSDIISTTNAMQAESSKAEAAAMLAEQNEPLDNFTLATMSSELLRRKFRSRRKFIAQTEVQAASEATRFLKGEAITRDPELSSTMAVFKVWNSLLDGRERLTHNVADGQERPNAAPFTVGGSSLRYPGDPAGPAREIINCRCFLTSRVIKI